MGSVSDEAGHRAPGQDAEVTAAAINVNVPESLRWTDIRREETFLLTSLNVRLLGPPR
jgi:hypothetical protein